MQVCTSSCLIVMVQGLRIMDLYSKKGIDPKRIYIKVCGLNAPNPNILTATYTVFRGPHSLLVMNLVSGGCMSCRQGLHIR